MTSMALSSHRRTSEESRALWYRGDESNCRFFEGAAAVTVDVVVVEGNGGAMN